jgi:Icc-related predicted phosphoesterase
MTLALHRSMAAVKDTVRLAAIGDIHYTKRSEGSIQPLFAQIADQADVLALCGDLTGYGLPEEAALLIKELTAAVKLPMVCVLGNHEYEAGKEADIQHMLTDAGVIVLDGDACEIHGLGFVGVKGFGGGFGARTLEAWGEEPVKRFVQEAVNEALKLESALARLRTEQRVALMHYAPIQTTVEGEPPEIFPFLGSSRLEEPLRHRPVAAVFHGHAHEGRPEGRTSGGIPVYNVCLPVMQRNFPERPPFRVLEISTRANEVA